jgi:hypothetical protein
MVYVLLQHRAVALAYSAVRRRKSGTRNTPTEKSQMANDPNSSNFMNPMMLWTDMSLRALDRTMSTSQTITEGVDRFARAGASVDTAQAAVPMQQATELVESSSESLASLQRSTFDLMAQSWVQWMSTFGSLASLVAGVGRNMTRRSLSGDGMFNGFLPGGQVGSSSGSRQQGGGRRREQADGGRMEHAFASSGDGEQKRRPSSSSSRSGSKTKSKSKARKSRTA